MSAAINDTPTPQEMTSAETLVAFPTNICGSGVNMYNQSNSMNHETGSIVPDLQSDIKIEPPEDINDIGDNVSNFSDRSPSDNFDSPKIRLTPTIKLMPVANPVDPKRRYACPYDNCTKSYGKSSHLRSHLTWHTGIKPFVCTELNCGKGFTRSDELNRHVRTHTGEKPFECIQCTKKFSRSDHLTKHLATHVKQMQSKSDGPKKSRKEGYVNHAKREYMNNSSATKACLKTTEGSDGMLEQHPQDMLQQQQKQDLEEYDDANGMHFMASLIESSSQKDIAKAVEPFLDHRPVKIKLERPENSDEYYVVQTNTPARTDSSATMSELALPVPNIKQENTTMAAPATPDGGFMGWPEIGKQGIHYEPYRPWRCNLCQKSFKRQDDLNRHLRTHTGEKPFVCVACDRGFKRSDHLKKHLKTHTNIRLS